MINNQEETFVYTYSAKQQEEISKIRNKYVEQKEDKMEQLRRLDASVTSKATMQSLIVGIIGTLILGLGMSLIMTNLNEFLNISKELSFVLGVGVGIVGIGTVGIAYPVYTATLKNERNRIAPEIIRLTDELMK